MTFPLAIFNRCQPATRRIVKSAATALCLLAASAVASDAKTFSMRSGERGGSKVSTGGETLYGKVTSPGTVTGIIVKLSTGRRSFVSVDKKTGQFAVRIFASDLATLLKPAKPPKPKDPPVTKPKAIEVEVSAVRELGVSAPEKFSFPIGESNDPLVSMLNRITFGTSPALLRRVNKIGYAAYLEEQLAPSKILDPVPARMSLSRLIAPMDEDDWERDQLLQKWRISNAAYSDRQLLWVMTLFWENHFWSVPKRNYLIDGQIAELKAFQANALGNFEDLLLASMTSPVMMDFLDNATSVKGSITENYAREILELHTVGVDGGYTNVDVRAVGDILTGWTVKEVDHPGIANPDRRMLVFHFDPEMHDTSVKEVPFINFKTPGRFGSGAFARGIALGKALAAAPQTRHNVCRKLVAQFISEDKPATAITVCEDAWVKTKGNIRSIMRALLTSDDFMNPANVRNKVKTPFEYVISTIREFGLYESTKNGGWTWALTEMLASAGQNFRSYPIPTGFKEQSTKWLSTASMTGRLGSMTQFVSSDWNVKTDYRALVLNAGMRSPEAIAAYLLTLGTADRYRLDEFQAVVEAVIGADRTFDADDREDAQKSVERAVGLIVTLPSYQLQ
jgi:uncharacterized protein (DUF1800 family)